MAAPMDAIACLGRFRRCLSLPGSDGEPAKMNTETMRGWTMERRDHSKLAGMKPVVSSRERGRQGHSIQKKTAGNFK